MAGLAAGLLLAALSWMIADLPAPDAALALVTSGLTGAGLGLAAGIVAAILVGSPPLDPTTICDACRYPRHGVDSARCPECGHAHA